MKVILFLDFQHKKNEYQLIQQYHTIFTYTNWNKEE